MEPSCEDWGNLIRYLFTRPSGLDCSVFKIPNQLKDAKKQMTYHKIHLSYEKSLFKVSSNQHFAIFKNPKESFYIFYRSLPNKKVLCNLFKVFCYQGRFLCVFELVNNARNNNQKIWMLFFDILGRSMPGNIVGMLLTFSETVINFSIHKEKFILKVNGRDLDVKKLPIFMVLSIEFSKMNRPKPGKMMDRYRIVKITGDTRNELNLCCKTCQKVLPFEAAFKHICEI